LLVFYYLLERASERVPAVYLFVILVAARCLGFRAPLCMPVPDLVGAGLCVWKNRPK